MDIGLEEKTVSRKRQRDVVSVLLTMDIGLEDVFQPTFKNLEVCFSPTNYGHWFGSRCTDQYWSSTFNGFSPTNYGHWFGSLTKIWLLPRNLCFSPTFYGHWVGSLLPDKQTNFFVSFSPTTYGHWVWIMTGIFWHRDCVEFQSY